MSQPTPNSSDNPSDELIENAKTSLLKHLRDLSFTDENIEQMILSLAADHPLKFHLVSQFLESLPEEEREAARNRLIPPLKEDVHGSVSEPVVLDDDGPYGPPID